MMTVEARKYVDGRIQAQISMKAHKFLRDHSQGEPLYVALDRIIGMYKVSEVAPIVEENRRLMIAVKCYIERMDEYKKEITGLQKQLERAKAMIAKFEKNFKDKVLTEFLE